MEEKQRTLRKDGKPRKIRAAHQVVRASVKNSTLDKAIAIIDQQINLLLQRARKEGLLDAREAEILIKYTKLLTELDNGKNKELQELKKVSRAEAKKLLQKETMNAISD